MWFWHLSPADSPLLKFTTNDPKNIVSNYVDIEVENMNSDNPPPNMMSGSILTHASITATKSGTHGFYKNTIV